MSKIRPKRHIVWFHDREIDLSDPAQEQRYFQQVLTHGRAEDVAALDLTAIRRLLPNMHVPPAVRRLWEDWFNAHR